MLRSIFQLKEDREHQDSSPGLLGVRSSIATSVLCPPPPPLQHEDKKEWTCRLALYRCATTIVLPKASEVSWKWLTLVKLSQFNCIDSSSGSILDYGATGSLIKPPQGAGFFYFLSFVEWPKSGPSRRCTSYSEIFKNGLAVLWGKIGSSNSEWAHQKSGVLFLVLQPLRVNLLLKLWFPLLLQDNESTSDEFSCGGLLSDSSSDSSSSDSDDNVYPSSR